MMSAEQGWLRKIAGLRKGPIAGLALACVLATWVAPRLSDALFRSEASDAVVTQATALLQAAAPPDGDVPVEDLGRIQHGGQLGVGRSFATSATFAETRQRMVERLRGSGMVLTRARSTSDAYAGCVEGLQVSLQYYVVQRQAMYFIEVVRDEDSIQPLGCDAT